MTAIATLYKWFSDLKKPNGAQFRALIDSFFHKSEKIPMSSIDGLDRIIEGTASAQQLQNHINDTHAHKEVLDKKVDKVPGKKLTTEDFTTELRTKLEGLQQVDTSGLLPKGGYTGTAQDLKNLIDAINRILQSDDTDLDQLQEIVTYIKQNKHILSTLGINNIAGLVEALAAKADKNHHHDERYAPITHHHNEYAHRTHRHNKDDIDGLPANIATTENIKTAVDGIQIGGRNLLLNSGVVVTNSNYQVASYQVTEDINIGDTITLSIDADVPKNCQIILLNSAGGGAGGFGNLREGVNFWDNEKKVSIKKGGGFLVYVIGNNEGNKETTIRKIKLERGNKATDWTPAPEDLQERLKGYEVSANTALPATVVNDTVFANSVVTLGLENIPNKGSVSLIKTFDNGAVSFTCVGKTIVYPNDNIFNGKEGSTAVVSVYNNKCYIRISNV